MKKKITLDADGRNYRDFNQKIHEILDANPNLEVLILNGVNGQRFIGNGIVRDNLTIIINGVAGGDLAMFMKGPKIIVNGNADHAPGNTMDDGFIVVHGSGGDVSGHSMRGGKVFIRDDAGYRCGIHMKEYVDKVPVLIIGGKVNDFLGEYMAGGIIINLNIDKNDYSHIKDINIKMIGTGIHGGSIYIRGEIDKKQLGVAADIKEFGVEDLKKIQPHIEEFCKEFKLDDTLKEILLSSKYTKISPISKRPFEKLYTPDLR